MQLMLLEMIDYLRVSNMYLVMEEWNIKIRMSMVAANFSFKRVASLFRHL